MRLAFARRLAGVTLAVSMPVAAAGQPQVVLDGTLMKLWTDPVPGSPLEPRLDYVLIEDGGAWRLLDVSSVPPRTLEGPGVFHERRAVVTGVPAEDGFRVASLRFVGALPAAGTEAALPSTLRYVTILCRFPDQADAAGVQSVATYQQWMGEAYPGMNHYWRWVSGDRLELEGTVFGWYELPGMLADYFDDPEERVKPDWGLLAQDCASRADPDVDFSDVDGLNLQFNARFGASWGGSGARLTLDGPERPFGVTWLAAWAGQSIHAHEIGHTFGLPHSSGPYGETYDSRWDVMSQARVRQDLGTWIAQGTNIFHRDLLGWVSPERTLDADRFGEEEAVRLEFRDGLPGTGYDMLRIPLDDGTFYVAEARRLLGYDLGIPSRGVLLHQVDLGRGAHGRALVVDADNNGDPNDPGAIWTSGETFVDPRAGVEITVMEPAGSDEDPGAGYRVAVLRGWRLRLVLEGAGRVWSPDSHLSCEESCSPTFPDPGPIALEAEAAEGLVFGGWTGACRSGGACTVRLDAAPGRVTAHFVEALEVLSEAERPAGVVGAEYRDSLVARGGLAHHFWSVTAGALPDGVKLDAGTGAVTGIPREAGAFEVEVTAISGALEATATFHLSVEVPVVEPARALDEILGAPEALTDVEARYLDIVGNDNGRFDVGDVYLFLRGGTG